MGNDGGTRRSAIAPALIAAIALGMLVVAGVLVAGPMRAGAPLWLPSAGAGTAMPVAPRPFNTQSPAPASHPQTSAHEIDLTLLFAVIGALIAAAILVFVLRRLLRRSQVLTAERDSRARAGTTATPAARTEEPAAQAVAHGIDIALQRLDGARAPGDAIVRAWLGLQDAAAASGVHRRPSETPAEFTSRVIARFGADKHAADELLGLYQGVRFGGHIVDAETVALARADLLRLRASWHENADAASGRPGARAVSHPGHAAAGDDPGDLE